MSARARDERIAIDHGMAGQETTGLGGAVMALRTLPVTLSHVRAIQGLAPDAWFINLTNPAGLITQAISQETTLRVIGICVRLIPTEYLFFYYSQRKAYRNQVHAGSSRGEELVRLNEELFQQLEREDSRKALQIYREYLLRRNASYMKLEAEAGSTFTIEEQGHDPFEAATGYHRIALDVMTGLVSENARVIIVNVANQGAIEDLEPEDIVEVPCDIDRKGAHGRDGLAGCLILYGVPFRR